MPDLTARQRREMEAARRRREREQKAAQRQRQRMAEAAEQLRRREQRKSHFYCHMGEVAQRRAYGPGTLLTLGQVAELWGVLPKTAREYRFQSIRRDRPMPHLFPREDMMLENGAPLWRFETIREFERPMFRQDHPASDGHGKVNHVNEEGS